ncbi:unnamed protein product [Microthlaspi erraticum]|uniref:PHD-type domain-containing protein n=1 Tax=Microthlaspi erraticum TaxID=1685480 RepID=A0A6D2JCL1_9BRAS|nr:unnamed protein product [Microthlaspi erraticum]
MGDSKDPCNFLRVDAELSPESVQQWLSVVRDGIHGMKMANGNRRSLSDKVKKHLSALGWSFGYFQKGKKRELRYKSPSGRWFYSLAKACLSCVNEEDSRPQLQIVPKSDSPEKISLVPCASVKTVPNPNVDSSKRKRKDLDTNVSSDSVKIVPNVDASKNKRTRVNDPSPDLFKIVLNIDVRNQQEKKSSEDKGETRPRVEKSLKKILQVMEKKNNKCEKEYVRFWRKDCDPDKNCDVCCVCHYGGDLLLCDGCPSAFHHTCLGFSSLPKEELWFCPCCCCDVCGSMGTSGNSKLMTCEQCQRRFHLKCLKEEPCLVSRRGWFCSKQCSRVFSSLESLLGRKIEVGDEGLVWTLLRAPNDDEHFDNEQLSKLESAVEILHQGFEPTTDPFSGRDLVEELIFRRDGSGKGRGFYTVLIERKKEPVTVAALRVDKDVAEIPLVATLCNYRRSGMCRVLMDELEKQMSRIGVVKLVLPAAKEVLNTWTERFGFSVMESSERLEILKHGMLDFVGTVMCHKFLMRRNEQDSRESSLTE